MTKAERFYRARRSLTPIGGLHHQEAEGGCGVVGLMSSTPIRGRHLYVPSVQMQNRGNGKGGGIAAVGLVPEEMKVSARVLEEDYILQLAYLEPGARKELEEQWLNPNFKIDQITEVPAVDDYRDAKLDVRPPDVVRYFTRVRGEKLEQFAEQKELRELSQAEIEDEFVFQNSYNINKAFYASLGEKRAFVMSHAKNLLVFKLVGFAEQAIDYYKLHDMHAHGWIAHQRYPTKGRVWHPGGAHPFIGMHEALVHNGDFANYYGVCEYLKQNGLHPLFLTDTEVSVLLFDLLSRSYEYPLEWVIESMAPTTERDFLQLPPERQEIYKILQLAHMNGSPDGPWFFIIARNDIKTQEFQLLGITDTSMLRPQVFSIHGGEVQIGMIASEKQAIDAALESISSEDRRVCPVADQYWNARGGSHTDGGAFLFSVDYSNGRRLTSRNKFGEEIRLRYDANEPRPAAEPLVPSELEDLTRAHDIPADLDSSDFLPLMKGEIKRGLATFQPPPDPLLHKEGQRPLQNSRIASAAASAPQIPRKWYLSHLKQAINEWLDRASYTHVSYETRMQLQPPHSVEEQLAIDARGFAAEGSDSLSLFIVRAQKLGWREVIVYRCRGHRFLGCGLHEKSDGFRLHIYGSSGDYLASGLDGAHIFVHGNAQDQLGQIFHRGKLVVYGDVGQTFFYGAKGGEAFIMGNAAGRPLINAVGSPRVVINGTCLDYLGESFMAGDPLKGGGFVILNAVRWNDRACIEDLPTPYPGSNLFSLASGGAIYVRDPRRVLDQDQLNGGEFAEVTEDDWKLIEPYLLENERLFHISVPHDLLRGQSPADVYRKIRPAKSDALR